MLLKTNSGKGLIWRPSYLFMPAFSVSSVRIQPFVHIHRLRACSAGLDSWMPVNSGPCRQNAGGSDVCSSGTYHKEHQWLGMHDSDIWPSGSIPKIGNLHNRSHQVMLALFHRFRHRTVRHEWAADGHANARSKIKWLHNVAMMAKKGKQQPTRWMAKCRSSEVSLCVSLSVS